MEKMLGTGHFFSKFPSRVLVLQERVDNTLLRRAVGAPVCNEMLVSFVIVSSSVWKYLPKPLLELDLKHMIL